MTRLFFFMSAIGTSSMILVLSVLMRVTNSDTGCTELGYKPTLCRCELFSSKTIGFVVDVTLRGNWDAVVGIPVVCCMRMKYHRVFLDGCWIT